MSDGSVDWRNNSVAKRNLYMLLNEIEADVKFSVRRSSDRNSAEQTVTYRAHTYILYGASSVFESMISGRHGQGEVIQISNVEPEAFYEVLRFIYSDEANITIEHVLHIMYLAKGYFLHALAEKCRQFLDLNLSVSNACILFEGCKFLVEEDLAEKCKALVIDDTQAAFESDSFLDIKRSTLLYFLKHDNLSISESEVFRFCLKLAKVKLARKNRRCTARACRRYLGKALYQIRFPAMSRKYFTKTVIPMKLLEQAHEEEIQRYLEAEFRPTIPSVLRFSTKPRNYAAELKTFLITSDTWTRGKTRWVTKSTAAVTFALPTRSLIENLLLLSPETSPKQLPPKTSPNELSPILSPNELSPILSPNELSPKTSPNGLPKPENLPVIVNIQLQFFRAGDNAAAGLGPPTFVEAFRVDINKSNTKNRPFIDDKKARITTVNVGAVFADKTAAGMDTVTITTIFSTRPEYDRALVNEMRCAYGQYTLQSKFRQIIVVDIDLPPHWGPLPAQMQLEHARRRQRQTMHLVGIEVCRKPQP